MPAWQRSAAGMRVTFRPLKVIVPDDGWYAPATKLKSVDFPAPFGPISPTIEPESTSKEILLLAINPPKRRDKLSISSIGPPFILLLSQLGVGRTEISIWASELCIETNSGGLLA